jgi:hypothetical protein
MASYMVLPTGVAGVLFVLLSTLRACGHMRAKQLATLPIHPMEAQL